MQAKVVKEGPWGANAGNAFDTGRVDRFTKVKIYHGDVIYGLELTFVVGGKPQPPMLIGTKKRASQE
uniref:Jacalin-type lectin domain-containing protein n=2 Tax=Musa acuminata subsp. malaccensis TaxID=214687 RepID=A0A804KUH6_MUSAM